MINDTVKQISRPSLRLGRLPESLRRDLLQARTRRGWSQAELARRASLRQAQVSDIESGKIAPRLDTLSDIARTLGYELVLVPRQLVPDVETIIWHDAHGQEEVEERPRWATDDAEDLG